MSPDRRQILGWGVAAAAGAALAPGIRLIELVQARSPEEAAAALHRWGLLIDTVKCVDCDVCVTACHAENGVTGHARPETDAQWIRKVNLRDKKSGHAQTLPLMCQHCEHPPCVDVCPTGASFKRADGIVLVNRHTCIGCRYCMMACPYKARSLVHEHLNDTQKADVPRGIGCVESCTLCVQKVDRGDGNTACAEACTAAGHNALLFGDMNDPESEISKRLRELPTKQVRADLDLNLGVRYHGI